jgi:hypothetical protein
VHFGKYDGIKTIQIVLYNQSDPLLEATKQIMTLEEKKISSKFDIRVIGPQWQHCQMIETIGNKS